MICTTVTPPENKKYRIVIVDDNPRNIRLIGAILRENGYLISVSQDSTQAMTVILNNLPDLILLDVVMPGINGYEICTELKQNPLTKDIPVIFLTALASTTEKVRGFNAGAVDYITKPVETDELLARIKTHLTVLELTRKLEDSNLRLEDKIQERTKDLLRQKEALELEVENRKEKEYIIQSASSAIITTDPDGRITCANPSFLKTWGYDHEDTIKGKSIFDIIAPDAAPPDIIRQLSEKGHWESEITVRNPQGRIIECRVFGNPVLARSGHPVTLMFSAIDITEMKKIEEEKRALQVQLQQAQKMEALGALAGGIAHDFNNILSPIVGYAEMALDDTSPGSRMRNRLEKIMQAALRAKDLVNQILSFSRQAELDPKPIKCQYIIKEALKFLRASIPKSIEIKQHIDAKCGAILADPIHIHQIIINLCANAYHAMPENGGEIIVALKETLINQDNIPPNAQIKPGRYVLLTVSDNGHGIEPAHLPRIFDPYFTTKEKGKGTGLGLSVIRSIVNRQGGHIAVSSHLNIGSAFTIYFPLIETTDNNSQIPSIKPPPSGNEHILLVDDEEQIALMQQQMLERLGYQVTVSLSSTEALNLFRQNPHHFNMLITDMTMPEMTGAALSQICLQIRPDFPIVLTTGFSESITPEKAKAIGVKGFLLKPVTRYDIAAMIRHILDDHRKSTD